MILVGLVIPLLLYLAFCLWARRSTSSAIDPRLAFLVVALSSSALALYTLSRGPAEKSTEIAWTGIESSEKGAALALGGDRDSAAVGWPNGAFGPSLRVAAAGRDLTLEISGGSGFVRTGKGYVNGETIGLEQAKTFADFTLQLERSWFLGRRLVISNSASAVARIDLFGIFGVKRDRVYSLNSLAEPDIIRLRRDEPAMASALESWSEGLRLLLTRDEDVRVVDHDTMYHASVQAPASLSILWPALTLPVRVSEAAGVMQIDFAPPWRLSSPMPPPISPGSSASDLTVTATPLPADRAFVIPVGAGLANLRTTVPLQNGTFQTPEGRPQKDDSELDIENVSSQARIQAGPFILKLATVKDLPSMRGLASALGLAVLAILAGAALVTPRLRISDSWTLLGITASIWTILILRVLLAYRYAMEPAYLDSLAISGLAKAFVALAVVPGIILMAAPLQRDRVRIFDSVKQQRRAGMQLVFYALCLAGAALVEGLLVGELWKNLPQAYHPVWGLSIKDVIWIAGTVGALVFALLVYVIFNYFKDNDRDAELLQASPVLRSLKFVSTTIPDIFYKFSTEFGSKIWPNIGLAHEVSESPEGAGGDDWEPNRPPFVRSFLKKTFIFLILWSPLIFAARFVNAIQDIVLPLSGAVLASCLLLSSRRSFPPGSAVERGFLWGRLFLVVATVIGLCLLLPPFGGDTGGIVAACAVFIPLLFVLAAGWRPMTVAGAVLLTGGLGVFLVAQIYLNLKPVLPFLGPAGQVGTRLLVFKEGSGVLSRLISSPVQRQGSFDTPSARTLNQALEHVWENQAIANQGGFPGLGYGRAPVRSSQVPQQVVQFDSTFSFFILGEHGVIGGAMLLLIYAFPLVFVLVSARFQFDVGHGLATVLASSFWLEALSQAGMNLGVIPFTGRDLPLLSVNSTSDIPRWCILFALLASAQQWRASGDEEGFRTPFSIISSPDVRDAEPRSDFYRALAFVLVFPLAILTVVLVQSAQIAVDPAKAQPFTWSALLAEVNNLAQRGLITVDPKEKKIALDEKLKNGGNTLLEQEVARFNELPEPQRLDGGVPGGITSVDQRLKAVRNLSQYDRLIRDLRSADSHGAPPPRPYLFSLVPPPQWVDEEKTIPAVDVQYKVEASSAFNVYVTFKTAARSEDFPTITASSAPIFHVSGKGFELWMAGRDAGPTDEEVVTLEDDRNGGLRLLSEPRRYGPRVRLFVRFKPAAAKARPASRFLGELEARDGKLHFRREDLRITVTSLGEKAREVPEGVRVELKPGDAVQTIAAISPDLQPRFQVDPPQGEAVVGPAWLNGDWRLVYNPDFPLPWVPHLRTAVLSEWAATAEKAQLEPLSRLTLDSELQINLQAFVSRMGREHHADTLAGYSPAQVRRYGATGAMPPRTAVAVIALPSGNVRAIAGWPRMNPTPYWQTGDNNEIIPPFDWIDGRAPRGLARRYAGDRNFDKVVLGSATKPIWASAVLSVHPGLDTQLRVRGGPGTEDSVFGIPIGRPWNLLGSRNLNGGEWEDFTSYLARSDNRYQIRLGFLGLATAGKDSLIANEPGQSPSDAESLDAGSSAWRRFPMFPNSIAFNFARPERMRSLNETELAGKLESMFGVGITRGEIQRRVSFWTGNEDDDWNKTGSQRFWGISPEAPDFGLDEIDTPRRFVNLLLGGDRNLWANVDFAAAFASAVGGAPVLSHITEQPKGVKLLDQRTTFPAVAARLRPGLHAVITDGTARGGFTREGALKVLETLPGVVAYAKTGTLSTGETAGNVSRIALALVRWDSSGTKVQQGLVFSVFVEAAEQGTATEWLGKWIAANADLLRRYMESS